MYEPAPDDHHHARLEKQNMDELMHDLLDIPRDQIRQPCDA